MPKRRFFDRFLSLVERVGNTLPHPATLFAGFALLVIFLSWVASALGMESTHPGTGEVIRPVNLLSVHGLHRILTEMVPNFTSFAPLGVVLVAMLGIGVAEGSGLISAGLKLLVLSSPKRLLTFVVVFAGILSNTASEVGYVLLVPLAAIIFLAVGRHPLAGIAAAFAGVSGGYSANLLLGTIDPLLAGISQEAAHIIDTTLAYKVNPACNYYFMLASTPLIALVGTLVTERVVEPRLGAYEGNGEDDEIPDIQTLSPQERRGLKFALGAFVLVLGVILWGVLPSEGFLREPGTGSLLRSPFLTGIVSIIFLSAAIMGIAFGVGAGTFKSDNDVVKGMGKAMETLGVYIVLVFFAAQFVAYFRWTNLGLILAIEGAELLRSANLGPIPLMVGFVFLTAVINLVMGSASAKWTVMAPVFIPMFMLLGYSPELTQVAYRVGDSVTNIISPMMSYFALVVAFMQRYKKDAGIGTIVATMLPYSLAFLAVWILLLVAWILLGLPIGPGAPLTYP